MRYKRNRSNIISIIIAVVILGVAAWLLIDYTNEQENEKAASKASKITSAVAAAKPKVVTKEKIVEKIVEKVVEVEKEITSETLQDGLNDMGILITQEYYFTQVENFSKTSKVLKFITSESNFIYSYDGVVTAGIDFSKVTVNKDKDNKIITVTMPKSEIQLIDIDYNSFKLYSEKEGLWSKTSITDFNDSLIDLEATAKEKAIDKGILDRADEGAEKVVTNFIGGMIDTTEYEIKFVRN